MEFSVGLSDAERERLALLAEECAEVIQVVGKILRHGYESSHPNGGPTNRGLLTTEMGHVGFAMTLCEVRGDVDAEAVRDAHNDKMLSVYKYLHFQD